MPLYILTTRLRRPSTLWSKKRWSHFWAVSLAIPRLCTSKEEEAKTAIDSARKNIAGLINARPSEVVFTAGGTESVNLAIFGVAKNYRNTKNKQYHFITSAIEHHCVINSFKALAGEGYATSLIGVDGQGFIKLDELKKAIRPNTVFISVMMANNEIGTIQPIAQISKWLKGLNQERTKKGTAQDYFSYRRLPGRGVFGFKRGEVWGGFNDHKRE